MTRWQSSCIKALATSPDAFLAFKLKQRNKKLLSQYLNRIWPYKQSSNNIIYPLYISELEDRNSRRYMYKKISKLNPHVKGYIKIKTKHDNFVYFSFEQFAEDITNKAYNNNFTVLDIDVSSYCKSSIGRAVRKALLILSNRSNFTNVGIEIEHHCDSSTPNSIIRDIFKHNCRDYQSGFDGDNSDRLRENRIRLCGIQGLSGLYILLADMYKNCSIDTNSSVHMHIDCTECPEVLTHLSDIVDKLFSVISHESDIVITSALNTIFAESRKSAVSFFRSSKTRVRTNRSFGTIEYRFCIPTFQYSDFVIQILALIHITSCFKYKCTFNKKFLTMLARVAKECRLDTVRSSNSIL